MSLTTITLDGAPVNLVALPATPGLRSVEFTMFDGVGVSRSPFTGTTQVQKWHGGDMWSGVAQLPPLAQVDADPWIAFLEELRGMANAFQMGDPAQPVNRGSSAGFPLVDNTLNNGNPAGSIFLGTKGWTPNAQGVLFPGDYIQVGLRLYRVLDFVNADANGQATFPIWPSLREQAMNDGTAATWINATGEATDNHSVSIGEVAFAVMWGGFDVIDPTLPADAVIQGIYPTILASGTFDICFQVMAYGVGLQLEINPGAGAAAFNYPYNTLPITPGASFASTQFYDLGPAMGPLAGKGIGTSLAALAGQEILMLIGSSLVEFPIYDAISATGVGFAVYYTSSTPTTDPLMPAPFTVPAGQGVAWAVPLSVTTQANEYGTVSGTPAIYNGTINMRNPVGLWRLATNKRDWAADFERATMLSFPFQEYR